MRNRPPTLCEVRHEDAWPATFQTFVREWRGRKGADDLWVQFSNFQGDPLDRVAWSDPDHRDMTGTYAYPLRYVVDYPSDIWYGFRPKFLRVLREKFPWRTLVLSTLNWGDVESIARRMGLGGSVGWARRRWRDRARGVTGPGKILMSLVQQDCGGEEEVTRPGTDQAALFLRAGSWAVEDRASRLSQAAINDREPQQICFLRPQAYEVLATYRLSDPRGRKGLAVTNEPSHLKAKLAAALAAALGDRIVSSIDLYRHGRQHSDTWWTARGREISVRVDDTSLPERMRGLRLGQKFFKRYRKHDPHVLSATVTGEKGKMTCTVWQDERLEDAVRSFATRWKSADPEDWTPQSRASYLARMEREWEDSVAASVRKEEEKAVADWPSYRSAWEAVAARRSWPSLPEHPSGDWPMRILLRFLDNVGKGVGVDRLLDLWDYCGIPDATVVDVARIVEQLPKEKGSGWIWNCRALANRVS